MKLKFAFNDIPALFCSWTSKNILGSKLLEIEQKELSVTMQR